MAFNTKPKKPNMTSQNHLSTTLFFIVLFTIPIFFILHTSSTSFTCTTSSSSTLINQYSGDLRKSEFAWNHLQFIYEEPPLTSLKIAVFSRKWPIGSAPGGMERHAFTLHTALALRGHRIHVYTSPPFNETDTNVVTPSHVRSPLASPQIHFHEGEPGKWRYNLAWSQFEVENQLEPFDVVHSESVALPHWLARDLPNLAVSWHGIALESLQSDIYQDLGLDHGNNVIKN
ncbi:hypothetical protein NE237_029413 [Protea cynaroides]|uniref:Glycosyltransferase subfamily 4-like N-terminal domain-containing protein n=1 Tax=Protea cynaroides TaxID=273540 RepID=A0A9Q0GR45_9MAGN|nr:hypothetical protein NE237_029413 [Protea cynaroides]